MGESKFECFSEKAIPGLVIISTDETIKNKKIVGYIVHPPTYMCKCTERFGNKHGFFERCVLSLIWPISCFACVISCMNDGYQVPVYVSSSIDLE